MRLSSFLLVALLFPVSPSSVRAADDEPEVSGLKKSEWIKMLDDPSARKRRAAVVALGVVGSLHKDVVPALGRALRDKDQAVRSQTIQVLAGMRHEDIRELVPEFADLIKEDPDVTVRQQAATLLGRIGPLAKPALSRLMQSLSDKEVVVRAAAAESIGRIGADAREASSALIPLLKDKEFSIRLAAIFSLGRIGLESEPQLDAMAKILLEDEAVEVRKEAARSIGLLEIAAKAAIPSLVKSLKNDASAEVRQQSAQALGKMGMEIANQKAELIACLKKDADKTVRLNILRTLSTGLGDGFAAVLPDLTPMLKTEADGEVRLALVQEIGALGPAAIGSLSALLAAQQDVQITIREAAKAAVKKVQAVEPKK